MEPKFNIRDEIEFTDGIILTVKDVIFAITETSQSFWYVCTYRDNHGIIHTKYIPEKAFEIK